MPKKINTLDLFRCDKCLKFTPTPTNYGMCGILKTLVYESDTFCEAEGKIDPNFWFMKDPHLKNYLKQEIELNIKILPKYMDRDFYRKKVGIEC